MLFCCFTTSYIADIMMLSLIKNTTLFTLILLIIGCSMFNKKISQQYTWEAQKSGPSGYPMEMISSTLYFKG